MEPIISVLMAGVAAAGAWAVVKLKAAAFVKAFGPTINQTFAVIDPIASQLIEAYDESTVQEALQLAVYRVADGELDEKDMLAIVKYVGEKFDVTKAAAAKLDPETAEGKASLEVTGMVKDLFDGADKEELIKVARAGISLVS